MARQKLYKNWTIRERMIGMLKAKYSATEVESRNKYVIYSAVLPGNKLRYFLLGSNGSVRINTTKAAATSVSYTDRFKAMLDKFEKEMGLGTLLGE